MLATTFAISLVLLVIYWIITYKQSHAIGYSHFFLSLWTLSEALPLYNILIIEINVVPDNFEDEWWIFYDNYMAANMKT